MPPTFTPPAKGAFAPEELLTVWSDWVEFWDVELILQIMLRTMAELAMLVLRYEEETGPSLSWQVAFLLKKMKGMITRKGFFKNSEGNLLLPGSLCQDKYLGN